jgi:hypothetical protein
LVLNHDGVHSATVAFRELEQQQGNSEKQNSTEKGTDSMFMQINKQDMEFSYFK